MIENEEYREALAKEVEEFIEEFENALKSIKINSNIKDNIKILIRIHHTLKGDSGIFELDNYVKFFREIELFIKNYPEPEKFLKIYDNLLPILLESLDLLKDLLKRTRKNKISDLNSDVVERVEKVLGGIELG